MVAAEVKKVSALDVPCLALVFSFLVFLVLSPFFPGGHIETDRNNHEMFRGFPGNSDYQWVALKIKLCHNQDVFCAKDKF